MLSSELNQKSRSAIATLAAALGKRHRHHILPLPKAIKIIYWLRSTIS
ncbi:MAG: hypothetical protein ACFCU7_08135 [Pleurocapsa sp.]